MPTHYTIDVEQRLVTAVFSGVITLDDIIEHVNAIKADGDFNPDFDQIIDAREATDARVGLDGLQRVEEIDPYSPACRRAFVVQSNSVVFGVARMYQILQRENPRIQICRSLEEAREWINV